MYSRIAGLAMLALLMLATFVGAADETYTLKFKDLGKGEVGSYDVTENNDLFIRILNSDNVSVFDQKIKIRLKLVFWEKILEKSEGKPTTQTRRGYGESRFTLDKDTTTLPVEGKRVTINRNGGKITFNIDGVNQIDGKQAEMLEREFDDPVNLTPYLPGKPIKVKQTWQFDAKPFANDLAKSIRDISFNVSKAEGIGKLNEVYEKEGRRFGKVTNHIEVPVTAINLPGKRIPLAKSDKLVIQVNYDCCIDGSAHVGSYKSTPYISTTANISEKGTKATIKIVINGDRRVTFSEMKKK
jgi:hypothetical protein